MRPRALLLALPLVALAAGAPGAPPSAAGQEFSGTWTASGRRDTVTIATGRQAAVFSLAGAVMLTPAGGLGHGFHGVALGFDDGEGHAVGRAVWTDEHGDQVWSRLEGEATAAGKRVRGTITGGSGRYAGAQGDYAFTWQYVLSPTPGEVQGRATALTGHVHLPGAP